jgi:hypothetical protein
MINHYSDSSLLEDEESKTVMLVAWEGDSPKPTEDSEWAPWLEGTTKRVMRYNAHLVKKRNRCKGAQVRAHAKTVQLAEEYSQQDPTNEQVRGILSESQGRLADFFQESVACNNHMSSSK